MTNVWKPVTGMGSRLIAGLLAALSVLAMAAEGSAFPVAPTALTYNASATNPSPPSQTVTFSKKSLVSRTWTASGDAAWLTASPASGTIAREQDQIAVQVNATGMAAGTYSGTIRISILEKNNKPQVTPVLVTLVVSGGSGSLTVTPSILLNPTSLSFSGTAGGPAPLAKPITISNPTGGTYRVFLVVAPLLPVAGVAFAYGRLVDPVHDLTMASPIDSFRLLLLRTVTVLAVSIPVGLVAWPMVPAPSSLGFSAWLLPALALTLVTLALSSRFEVWLAGSMVGGGWVAAMLIALAEEYEAFDSAAQIGYAVLAVSAAAVVALRRERYDREGRPR